MEPAANETLRSYKNVLAALFEPEWLDNPGNAAHPAVQQRSQLDLALDGKIPRLEDRASIFRLGRLGLDANALFKASGGDPRSLRFGDFANYGDERVLPRVLSVARDPEQYNDLLVELGYAAWHLGLGHAVRAFEAPGFADFRAQLPSFERPVIADCKALRADKNLENLDTVLSTANKQIKKHGQDGIGVVFIDASALINRVRFLRPKEDGHVYTPPEAKAVREACARQMIDCNKSLSVVVIAWTDVSLRLKDEDRSFRLIANRPCIFHVHGKARCPVPDKLLAMHTKGNGGFGMTFRPTGTGEYESMLSQFIEQDGGL